MPKSKEVEAAVEKREEIVISAPRMEVATFDVYGTSPYVQLRFSEKPIDDIMEKQKQGSAGKNKKRREPRNFERDYEASMYEATEGWRGIPCASFRNAMISACRLVDYKMTIAKMSIFVLPDGIDKAKGRPLVRIYGNHEMNIDNVRNFSGVLDLRSRAMWREWSLKLRVQYDADQFSLQSVTNLLRRAGIQVGVGEGRHDSRKSCGMGYGCFDVKIDSIEHTQLSREVA